jgi:addiction module RelE/StbE family toxin
MTLNVTPEAIQDVVDIKNYIRNEFDNPVAAERIANRIINSYERLETSPYLGKRLDAVSKIKSDYRFLVCERYLIFYDVNENNVSVHRVIHGKRDYCRLLFNDIEEST